MAWTDAARRASLIIRRRRGRMGRSGLHVKTLGISGHTVIMRAEPGQHARPNQTVILTGSQVMKALTGSASRHKPIYVRKGKRK